MDPDPDSVSSGSGTASLKYLQYSLTEIAPGSILHKVLNPMGPNPPLNVGRDQGPDQAKSKGSPLGKSPRPIKNSFYRNKAEIINYWYR